jgi:large repetitive protein
MALIIGGFGKDTLNGTASADLIFGLTGDDKLYGKGGNDILFGDLGNDRLDGGDGFDTVNYADSFEGVNVALQTNICVGGEAEGDTLFSIEGVVGSLFRDTITGNGENNHLYGLSGADALLGGGGNDKIDGGLGADKLTGGDGSDKFVFRPFDGKDRILDFDTARDRMDLRDHGYGDFAAVMADASQSGANTIIDFGGGEQVMLIGVLKSSLDAGDFIL